MDFKLNYYFQMYKDICHKNSLDFKKEFIKKHGNYDKLGDLYILINNYQIKNYGSNLANYADEISFFESKRVSRKDGQQKYNKYGTMKDRNRRKKEYE